MFIKKRKDNTTANGHVLCKLDFNILYNCIFSSITLYKFQPNVKVFILKLLNEHYRNLSMPLDKKYFKTKYGERVENCLNVF